MRLFTLRTSLAAACVAALAVVAGGLASTSGLAATSSESASGAITVWVDAPRVPAVNAFKKAYPNIPIKMNLVNELPGSTDLEQKFALFNQSGSGWPDAIFFPSNDDIAWASSPKIHYTADLGKVLPKSWVRGYSAAAIAPCMIDGKLQCVRNDAAPDVLWYNAKLFKAWGYKAPTTWPQYQAVSLKIAKQHPGYYTGMLGDAYAPDRYFWASGCPTNDRRSPTQVHINTNDPKCTRVIKMLDSLLAAKVVSPAGIFDTAAAKTVGPKTVMTPGAAWYGDYLFRDTFKVPKGQMTATTPLRWPSDPRTYTGDEGGGLWGVSSHISGQELANTLVFAKFVASDARWQVKLSTGLPAYGPLQSKWLANANKDAYFTDFPQLEKAFKFATTAVRPQHAYMLYNTGSVWTQTVTPGLTSGKNMSGVWKSFTSQLVNQAKSVGYSVVDK
jgi:ABC-type glycerol-3-phosphate transport system substrate-binding protein